MSVDGGDPSTLESTLYRAINPTDLPRIEWKELTSGTRDGIYAEAPGGPRKFQRYAPAFVDDPDDAGVFPGGIGLADYLYPPVFAATAAHATLVGYRTLLTRDHRFFTDEAYAEPDGLGNQLDRISKPDPFANEQTGLYPAAGEGLFRLERANRPTRKLEGTVVVLCSDEPFSYGSFLFRVVPKVKSLVDLGLSNLPCLVFAEPKPFKDLLIMSGLPEESLIFHDVNNITEIEKAIVPGMRSQHAYLDPGSCELYAQLRAWYGVRPTGKRIYVSRLSLNQSGRGASRIMTNETELIAKLKSMRFEVVEPENLTVREQILAFSSASIVVGPSGSGLFNTMFCHPGTKLIDIQSEPQWIYSYTGMYSSLQLDYGIFVGNADPEDTKPVHRRFSVNIDALVSRIRSFIAEVSW